jgi:DNA-binding CsgD family transcriptional regulator
VKKGKFLLVLIFFAFNIACYGQYSISGFVNSKEKNNTVYLSLLKYNEETYISNEQIVFSTQTDSSGYFEIKGKLLSDKNKLYRIHANIDKDNLGLQLSDVAYEKNFHNFIFSNRDTIYFPAKNKIWFSNSDNSNSVDKQWKESLEYELKLLEGYDKTRNPEAILQAKKSFSSEFKLYITDSIASPLIKLLAYSHLKRNGLDFNENADFYYDLQHHLNEYYSGTSYYLQFQDEISKLSISAISKNNKFHRNLNYFLGTLSLILLTIIFFLFQKVKVNKTQEIINEVSALTNQEEKIANLICEGMSNKEIAATLFISQSTVKTHIRNLYSKLEILNRQQLIEKLKNQPQD